MLLGLNSFSQEIDKEHWERLDSLNKEAHALTSSDIDSAETINSSLFHLIKEPIDTLVLSNINSVQANIFYNKGDFEKSLKYNLACLKLRQQMKDTFLIGQTYVKFANIYYATNDYDKCRDYLKENFLWLKLAKVDRWVFANNRNTMALSFLAELQLDSAIKYFELGLQDLAGAPENYLMMKAKMYGNIASVYQYENKNNKALLFLDSAISISLENRDFQSSTWTYYKKAEILLSAKEYKKAFKNLKYADSLSSYSSTLDIRKNIQYGFFKYYLLIGENDSALKYNAKYYNLNDSVIEMQTNKNIQEIEAKYQVEKKQAALELVEEKATNLSLANKTKDLYIAIILVVFAIVAISLLAIYYSVKNKRKLVQLDLKIKENQLDEMMAIQESSTYSAMLKGQEKERERIAQDLHDRLGGTLAALKLSLRRPENSVGKEDLAIVDEAVNEVRSIAHNLSSGLLQKYGLNEALLQLKQTIERTSGIQLKVYLHQDIALLDQSAILGLYRIVQELVSNTLKHANASEISVQTNSDGTTFNLIYEDNGKGFNPKEVKQGIGLENIKARVKKMNGSLHVDAEKGRGSIFIVELNQQGK
ncbi:MAG: sensor histidine kinase [Bacteroidetes bacterium]|nr:sensor histidine kinase [Bacteroidota bacterium]